MTCPRCGHCPHCGRDNLGGYTVRPYYPWINPGPVWIWGGAQAMPPTVISTTIPNNTITYTHLGGTVSADS